MEEEPTRKLAVILHADVVGSTGLVRANETVAHQRIRDAFERFSEVINTQDGIAHEIRGDALVAEFSRASDAVEAAVAFQDANTAYLKDVSDGIKPVVRVSIAMGEVVVADNTVTGEGVVLAQRLEQLARPGGVCIQDAAYQTVPKRLPFEYENLGEQELKGFDEPVKAYAVRQKSSGVKSDREISDESSASTVNLSDKPSIAVLPFDNMTSDSEQEYLADGIAEELITALSKFRWFYVTARNSTFTYKGTAVDVKQVGRELGVQYVLEGSVRKAGSRVRVTAQLIEAKSGNHIWAERYDRELEDIFDLQDEMTRTIASAVEPELASLEREQAQHKPTSDLRAWDLFHRGVAAFHRTNKEGLDDCADFMRKAIKLDPDFSQPHGFLAFVAYSMLFTGWAEDDELTLRDGMAEAHRAISIDPRDYFAHFALGRLHLIAADHTAALRELNLSVSINPNFAHGYYGLAAVSIASGDAETALGHLELAIRLSPSDPLMWAFLGYKGICYTMMGNLSLAVEVVEHAIQIPNVIYIAFMQLAALYAHLDRPDDAISALGRACSMQPELSIAFARKLYDSFVPSLTEKMLDGLRMAGLREQ